MDIIYKTVLAIDFGTKKMGLALGEPLTGNSFPLDIVDVIDGEPNWLIFDKYIKEWKPSLFVLGYPQGLTKNKKKITYLIEEFAETLKKRYELPYELVDESYSSFEARELLKQLPKKKTAKKLKYDDVSAILILNYWLDSKNEY